MENKKITIGLVAVLAVSLCLNVYLYMGSQNSKATIAGLQVSYSEKEQQLSDLQNQLSAMTASLETAEGKIAELAAALETAGAEKEALTANIETAKAELEALELAKAEASKVTDSKCSSTTSQAPDGLSQGNLPAWRVGRVTDISDMPSGTANYGSTAGQGSYGDLQ